ncbi:MAG: protein of unknown function DUF3306 [Saliniramus fredricksonii]|uniref:DUF3306 domain-containing protein n=1 Tax=Saliniramus fredricksonii TaxID=1653334 RepID=A0A0P8BP78_9HYPH|nr:DUF3306 domain-containing protein [Saliniramus fredricksonii]KPQ11409.1 MAG: protein of unknown function DUF3306 [Saliniramus fredricksonii]SCC81941.1 Protein of unknown function [Saliniramus fredricksonii]
MSGGFLGRWSQRKLSEKEKQEAQRKAADSADPAEAAPETSECGNQPQDDAQDISAAPQQAEMLSEQELAALPSLDSITTQTDLRQFLRKGVPGALKNAALRKMWLLDPAIRNHVDYAVDYAWDWNVPGGVPGHGGQIAGESVAKMLEKLLPKPVSDETATLAEAPDQAPAPTGGVAEAQPRDPEGQPEDDPADRVAESTGSQFQDAEGNHGFCHEGASGYPDGPQSSPATRADSDSVSRSADSGRIRHRRHGGALPS